MMTSYDIESAVYRIIAAATQGSTPTPVIGGHVYNGDRPLNSSSEDVTVRVLSLAGDGYPQDAIVNVNAYVPDIAEPNGGHIRNGVRLKAIAQSLTTIMEEMTLSNASVSVESVTEISEDTIRQHYVNFRVRIYVYGNIN